MLSKIGPDMLQLEMKFGQAIAPAVREKRSRAGSVKRKGTSTMAKAKSVLFQTVGRLLAALKETARLSFLIRRPKRAPRGSWARQRAFLCAGSSATGHQYINKMSYFYMDPWAWI
jgi:hypothetical protein